jgi:hypothetical protein
MNRLDANAMLENDLNESFQLVRGPEKNPARLSIRRIERRRRAWTPALHV